MTRKDILNHVRTVLPSLARYYNDQGEYVEGEDDSLAAYVATVLIDDYDRDADLGEGSLICHLTAILEQAIADLTLVCEALESYPSTNGRLRTP
jgi:hypothetical protein